MTYGKLSARMKAAGLAAVSALVLVGCASTGGGKTVACTICHGPTLKGMGDVPSIAGQSPVTIARQLYLMATGERAGSWAPLMKGVVEKLNNDDIVAISAFVASLEP